MIPDSVTSIESGAFSGCSGLTSVVIPDSVTNIGSYAFSGCTGLTSVVIPDSVTSIESGAFYGCSRLPSFTIPNGVTSIGSSTFSGCTGLTSVVIPGSVTSIEANAFSNCSGLVSITIGDGVTSIGNYAFSGCTSLTSFTIPDSVTTVGQYVLSGCSSLESVTIPFVGEGRKTAKDSGQYPFGYLFGKNSYNGGTKTSQTYYIPFSETSSTVTYYIPATLRTVTVTDGEILYGAFSNCAALTSITIPNGVTSIGNYAFSGCTSLTSFTIPDSVTSIGKFAFSGCTGLVSITVPNGVTSIGSSAFSDCDNLGCTEYEDAFYFGNESNPYLVLWKVKTTSITSFTVHPQTKFIYDYAFRDCIELTSVEIPDGVIGVGQGAFYGCTGLTFAVIPDSVTSIGAGVFYSCTSLESLTIPFVGDRAGVTAKDLHQYPIGHIFGGSSNAGATMQSYYNNSTDYLVSGFFAIPSSLKSVTVTGGEILYGAFYGCGELTSVTIPGSVTGIGGFAFYDCFLLTSITYQGTITEWLALDKGDNWNSLTGSYVIHCTDGDLAK